MTWFLWINYNLMGSNCLFLEECALCLLACHLFLKKFLEDISPFCGATDTPVLDLWWHFLWVGSLIYVWQRHMCYTFPEIHLWCDTCQHLGGQHGSRVNLFYMPVSRHWWGPKLRPIVPQMNALLTEQSRLSSCFLSFWTVYNAESWWICLRITGHLFIN